MTKQTALKNIIWAICIGLALLALVIGLFIAAVDHYYGEKTRPVMNIGSTVSRSTASAAADSIGAGKGTAADGTLHELKSSRDAGQSYLDSLTFLCDSSSIPLKSSGLVSSQVWGGEDGTLPMTTAFSWRIHSSSSPWDRPSKVAKAALSAPESSPAGVANPEYAARMYPFRVS